MKGPNCPPTGAEVVLYLIRLCSQDLYDTIYRRLTFFIADKKAACFALGGALKARALFWILLKCELECCTESNCNTQTPTLTEAAIPVFTPDGNTETLKFLK